MNHVLEPTLPPWQIGTQVPHGYWQGAAGQARAQAALHTLLQQLGVTDATAAAARVTRTVLREQGLGGMLDRVFNGSLYQVLASVFPELQPWQVGDRVPRGYWRAGPEQAGCVQAALRYLLQQSGLEQATPAQIEAQVQRSTFKALRLDGLLQRVYQGNLGSARRALIAELSILRSGPPGCWPSPSATPLLGQVGPDPAVDGCLADAGRGL